MKTQRRTHLLLTALASAALVAPRAYGAKSSGNDGAAAGKGGKASAAASAPAAPAMPRASWLGDSRPLRPGDLLTIIVDERTQANETESHVANTDHSTRGDLNADITDSNVRIGPSKSISAGLDLDSNHQGTTGRTGDFTAVMTVNVLSIDALGVAVIRGERQVMIDGRLQDIKLTGKLRTQDVMADNTVQSSRIGDAQVLFNGKKINPKVGFISNLLGLVWP